MGRQLGLPDLDIQRVDPCFPVLGAAGGVLNNMGPIDDGRGCRTIKEYVGPACAGLGGNQSECRAAQMPWLRICDRVLVVVYGSIHLSAAAGSHHAGDTPNCPSGVSSGDLFFLPLSNRNGEQQWWVVAKSLADEAQQHMARALWRLLTGRINRGHLPTTGRDAARFVQLPQRMQYAVGSIAHCSPGLLRTDVTTKVFECRQGNFSSAKL